MSKFTKISLLVAGVLFTAGFGFMIAGMVLVGGPATLLSELRSGAYNFGNWHFEDGIYYKGDSEIDVTGIVNETLGLLPGGKEVLTESFAEEITDLKIDADLANIEIKTADVQEIIVNVKECDLDCYESEIDGETVWIRYDTGTENFSEGAEIEIEVPYQIAFEHISVYTDLGEIKVTDIQSEYIYLGTDLGNIAYSGAAMVLDAETDMGNIQVRLAGQENDYNIDAETDLGTVTYNGKKMQGGLECWHDKHHHYSSKSVTLYSSLGNIELDVDFSE